MKFSTKLTENDFHQAIRNIFATTRHLIGSQKNDWKIMLQLYDITIRNICTKYPFYLHSFPRRRTHPPTPPKKRTSNHNIYKIFTLFLSIHSLAILCRSIPRNTTLVYSNPGQTSDVIRSNDFIDALRNACPSVAIEKEPNCNCFYMNLSVKLYDCWQNKRMITFYEQFDFLREIFHTS